MPEYATIERVVRKRKPHEVYIDYLQNIRGKTVASRLLAAAAARGARFDAAEMGRVQEARSIRKAYTIKTIFKRLDKFGDLFEKALTDRQDIGGFLNVLEAGRKQNRDGVKIASRLIHSTPNQNV